MDKLFLPDYHEGKYRGPIPSESDGLLHMTEGLAYLHRIDVTHGDIKPQHILISLTDPPVMKLAGFGLAKKVSSKIAGSYTKKDVIDGGEWTAPEILKLLHEQSYQINKSEGNDVIKKTLKSDIFSAGLTFFYWLTEGIHPFGDPLRFKRWVMADIFHNRPVNIERKLTTFHKNFTFISSLYMKLNLVLYTYFTIRIESSLCLRHDSDEDVEFPT